MSHKQFFLGIVFICIVAQVIRFLFSVLVDPVCIWGTPLIRGFNHYKVKQINYLDVFHPYSYMREKPDILYMGTSQVCEGFKPVWDIYPNKKIYAFAPSASTLSEMKEQLRFVYRTHKPEIVYLELIPEFFIKSYHTKKKQNYSKERLYNLGESPWSYLKQITKDTLSLHDVYTPTIRESFLHTSEGELFWHGWRVSGETMPLHPERYYSLFYRVLGFYRTWEYSQEAMECFYDIVEDAKAERVPLVCFFAPTSVDMYAGIQLLGHMPDVQQVKRDIAQVMPVYDFYVVNSLTAARQTYFLDATHFNTFLGEKLKYVLSGNNPEGVGYLLTPETCDAAFAAEDAAWEKWRAENAEYVQALTECIESGRKPEVGEFKKYIGF